MVKPDDVSALRERVEALQSHVSMRDAGAKAAPRAWWDRRLDVWTFILAVIGAAVCIVFGTLAWWPLAIVSYKHWFGT